MKKFIYLIIALHIVTVYNAQVGINTNTPNATLDVNSANTASAKDGLIPPKLTRQELANKLIGTYTNTQAGAIVYITDITVPTGTPPSLTQTTNISTLGYYYFDGSLWQKIGADTTNDAWINGTGRVELSTKANGSTRDAKTDVSVYDNGRIGVGIGSESPDGGLHIRGDNDGYKDDIRLDSYSGNLTTAPAANFRFYAAKGTVGALENLSVGNTIGQINFQARIGGNNNFPSLARIWSSYEGDGNTSKASLNFSASGAQNNSLIITADQNVGISTASPTHKLHISSGTTTLPVAGIKIVDGYQGNGKVLTSDADGVGKWSEVAITKISGVMRAPNSTIPKIDGTSGETSNNTVTIESNHNGGQNLGSYIDLPPGKWEVEANVLIDVGQPSGLNYLYNKFTFTESSNRAGVSKSSDLPPTSGSGWLIGGGLVTFGHTSGDSQQYYGIVNGKVTITNISTATKRYYLMYHAGIRKYTNFAYADSVIGGSTNSASQSIIMNNLGSSSNGENYISALKIQ